MENQTPVTPNPEQQPVVDSGSNKPTNKKSALVIVKLTVIAIVCLIGIFLFFRNSDEPTPPPAQPVSQAIEVSITDSGFVPSTIVVAKGAKVVWKNDSASPRRIGSNPYPDHTSLPSLYSKDVIAPGQTYSYTFNDAGEWGYSDYTVPTNTATVVVK